MRFFVAFMTFMITFVAYMLRANISISILAMVQKNELDPDVSVTIISNRLCIYNWNFLESVAILILMLMNNYDF